MTMLVTFQDLLVRLRDTRVPHQADVQNQAVEMPCKTLPGSEVTYLRWEQRLPYLQIVQPVVRQVLPARYGDVFREICAINDAEPIGGFALEPGRRFIYTRRTLAVYEDGIPATWVERELAAVQKLAADQYARLAAVARDQPNAT